MRFATPIVGPDGLASSRVTLAAWLGLLLRVAPGCTHWLPVGVFVPSASILSNVLVTFTRDGLRRGDFTLGLDYA